MRELRQNASELLDRVQAGESFEITNHGRPVAALALAAQLPPPAVRTRDALHVASVAGLAGLDALVSYDQRLLAAAHGYGLPVASPH